MLTLNLIREKTSEVIRSLQIKNFDAKRLVDDILALDEERRSTQSKLDGIQSELNSISKEIGSLIQSNRKEEAEARKNQTVGLKKEINSLTTTLANSETALRDLLIRLPNLPSHRVPPGSSPEENVVERSGGTMPQLAADMLPHWDLARIYDIIDFELGNKITGAGFPYG
jgi:seryl-tRNA synthetase